jgi:hypothetical protein
MRPGRRHLTPRRRFDQCLVPFAGNGPERAFVRVADVLAPASARSGVLLGALCERILQSARAAEL